MAIAERGWFIKRNLETQATLAGAIRAEGIGLHTGRHARVRLLPQPANTGIEFVRLENGEPVASAKADWRARKPAYLCTALNLGSGYELKTIEHVLSTLAAFAIDNVRVEVEGSELPIFDGSAIGWCIRVLDAGVEEQPEPRRYVRILKPVEVREPKGDFLRLEPKTSGTQPFSCDIGIKFSGFEEMRWRGEMTPWKYMSDIAPSRSYGLVRWGLPLKLMHLFTRKEILRGANLFTTGLVWRGRFIGGMHVEDEPVRHRVLDLMGDMALAGAPIHGHVTGFAPRHDLNHLLVKTLMERADAWDLSPLSPQVSTTS